MRTGTSERQSLYAEVTDRMIAELEEGRLPWVQPWDAAACGCAMPAQCGDRAALFGDQCPDPVGGGDSRAAMRSQRWLTYRQAQAAGGNVRKGERGTTICYADRFTPKDEADAGARRGSRGAADCVSQALHRVQCRPVRGAARGVDRRARAAAAEIGDAAEVRGADRRERRGLPDRRERGLLFAGATTLWRCRRRRHSMSRSTGIAPRFMSLAIGPGIASRLDREPARRVRQRRLCARGTGRRDGERVRLRVAGDPPTVRHADYIGSWLTVLREDERAIFRAASAASKAADYLLAFEPKTPEAAS